MTNTTTTTTTPESIALAVRHLLIRVATYGSPRSLERLASALDDLGRGHRGAYLGAAATLHEVSIFLGAEDGSTAQVLANDARSLGWATETAR